MKDGEMTQQRTVEQSIIENIQRECDCGNPSAIFELANVYYFGMFGGRPDCGKAIPLYHRAAQMGHVYSRWMLANCYFYGIPGGVRDYVNAAKEFEMLCKEGWSECWFFLGRCYAETGHAKKAEDAFQRARTFKGNERH